MLISKPLTVAGSGNVIAAALLSLTIGDRGLSQDTSGGQSGVLSTANALENLPISQRVWTNDSGQSSTTATLLAVKNDWVLLETEDGRRVSVAISKLSGECQRYVEAVREAVPDEAPTVQPKGERLQSLDTSPGARAYATAWDRLMTSLGESGRGLSNVAILFPEGGRLTGPEPKMNPDIPNANGFMAVTVGEKGAYGYFIDSHHGNQMSIPVPGFSESDFHPMCIAVDGGMGLFVAADGKGPSLRFVKQIAAGKEVDVTVVEAIDPSGRPLRDIRGLAFGEGGKLYVACSGGVVVFSANPLRALTTLDPGFSPAGVAAHHKNGYVAAHSATGEVAILPKDGTSWLRFSNSSPVKHIAFVAPKEVIVVREDGKAAVARAE